MRVRVMVLALVVFLLDQLSKLAVLHWLRPLGSIEMPGGFWSLTYSENTGGAFSLMAGHNHLFVI
ncbi:MAG: signal peptidase II, partial [Candidatus Eremiobacteraeota bacterium]|nr:signal peptidase II [Candidatus Eremiobacteraeota bacterium]